MNENEQFSDLEKFLFFKDEAKGQLVQLIPIGTTFNQKTSTQYFANYELNVKDNGEEGFVSFGEYKAIINCGFHSKKINCSFSVKEFNERFSSIIKALVPKDIYNQYLKSLDMGREGIFKEAGRRQYL